MICRRSSWITRLYANVLFILTWFQIILKEQNTGEKTIKIAALWQNSLQINKEKWLEKISSWIAQNIYHELLRCVLVYSYWHDYKLFWKNWKRNKKFLEFKLLWNVNFLRVLCVQRRRNIWTEQVSMGKRINFVTVSICLISSINVLGLLAWNQSSNMLKLRQRCLSRIHSPDARAGSSFLKSTCWFNFFLTLTFEIVLHATGEALNQLINVPLHALADYRVIMKSMQKQQRFKAWFLRRKSRTEQDNLGSTVSEDPQKAILVAFGWFWSLGRQSGIVAQIDMYV
jgi:hypothetical protein